MKRTTILGAVLACALPVASNAATIINFEIGYSDNEVLSSPTELLDSTGALSGVTLTSNNGSMSVEASDDDAITGFVNDTLGTNDAENSGLTGLGGYFLRTTNALSGNAINPVFSLDFGADGVLGVSGEIWDIDGNGFQGTEQWEVVANLKFGGTSTIASPEVGANILGGPDFTLDGLPWMFDFDGVGVIQSLDFVFTGTKVTGIGAAIDNLALAPIPLPAGGLLLLSGLGAAFVMRRRAS